MSETRKFFNRIGLMSVGAILAVIWNAVVWKVTHDQKPFLIREDAWAVGLLVFTTIVVIALAVIGYEDTP